MKINLKKWVAIGLSMMSLMSVTVYGAEVEEKQILTIESAIESAQRKSTTLSLNIQQNKVMEEKIKTNQNQNGSYLIYQQLNIQKQQNERDKGYIQDQIAYDVTTRYNNLVNLEKEIGNLEKEIEIQSKSLSQLKLQKEKGLISKLQYESAELELQNLRTTLKTKQETLSSDKNYFKVITGKNVEEYLLDDTIKYEPFRIEGSIEGYCDRLATEYFKYNKELAQLAKDNIIVDGMPGPEYSDYLNSKYNAEKTLTTIEDSTKTMKQSLMSTYSNLLNMEEQINTLQYQVQFMEQQVDTIELQQKLGLKTKLDYEKQVLSLDKLQLNLRTMITNYNKLLTMLQKPWVSMM